MPAKTITTDTDGVPSHGTCSTSGDGTPPMSAVPRHTPPLPHIHPHTHVQDFRATYFDEASLNQALELYEIGDTFGVAQLLVSMSTSRVTPLVVPHRTPAGPRSRSGSGIMEGAAASNPVQTISTRTLHTNARAWELLGRSYEHSERLLEARRSFYHAAQLYREHGQYLLHAQYLECRMLAVSTAPSVHFCSAPWEGTTHKLKALEKVESILASLPSTMAPALTLPAVTSLTLRTPSVQTDLLGWMKLRAFRVTLNAHLGRWAEVLQLGRALLQDLELSPEHSAEASIVDRVAMLKQEVHHVYVTTALALHLDHYPKRMQTLGGNVESGLIPLHDDVLGLIKAGLQICPRCYHAHSTLLRLWMESGETSRAIEYVDTLIATHSSASDTCSTSHRMLYLWIREKSMLLAQQGNVEEALAVLQDSIRSARRVYQTAHYPSIFPTRSPAASSFLERKMTAPSLGSLASNTPHTGSTTPREARGDPCFFTTFSSSQSQHNTPPTTSLPAQLPSAGPLALGTNAHGGLEKHSVFPSSESLDGPGAGGNSETQSDPCSVGGAAMTQGTPATSTTPPLAELTDRIAAHGVVAPPPALPLYCACVLLHLQRGDGEAARDALNSVVNDYPTFAHSMHDTPNEWQLLRTQVLRKCGIEYLERNRVGEFLSHLIRTTVPPRATSLEDEESDGKGNGEEDAASAREEPFPTGVEFISGLSFQMVSSSEEKNAVVGMELVQTLQRIVDAIECRTNKELTVKE